MTRPDLITASVATHQIASAACEIAASCATMRAYKAEYCTGYADHVRDRIATIRTQLNIIEAAIAVVPARAPEAA